MLLTGFIPAKAMLNTLKTVSRTEQQYTRSRSQSMGSQRSASSSSASGSSSPKASTSKFMETEQKPSTSKATVLSKQCALGNECFEEIEMRVIGETPQSRPASGTNLRRFSLGTDSGPLLDPETDGFFARVKNSMLHAAAGAAIGTAVGGAGGILIGKHLNDNQNTFSPTIDSTNTSSYVNVDGNNDDDFVKEPTTTTTMNAHTIPKNTIDVDGIVDVLVKEPTTTMNAHTQRPKQQLIDVDGLVPL